MNRLRFLRAPSGQLGQSLSEFLIVAVMLLIPLLLIIPLLAMVMAQGQDAEVAARYAAWEFTVWDHTAAEDPGAEARVKSADAIGPEIDARVLSKDDAPLISDAPEALEIDPFGRLIHSGQALLASAVENTDQPRYAQVHVRSETPAGSVEAADAAVSTLDAIGRFELERRGVTVASIRLDLIDLEPFFAMQEASLDALSLTRENALFTEAWTGGSKSHTEYLIGGLTPQQYFDSPEFRSAQRGFAHQPYGEELGPDSLIPGYADIDPLPEYRLAEGAP